MAIIVEDGSGKNDAVSYIDATFFSDHHTARGRDLSEWNTAAIEAACVKATDYVDQRFGLRFRGDRQLKDQALQWPRLDAYDDDGFAFSGLDTIPRDLKKAVAEYARIVLTLTGSELLPNPAPPFASINEDGETVGGASGQVTRDRSVVGPIEEEKWYESASNTKSTKAVMSGLVDGLSIPEYPRADLWIEKLLKPKGVRLVRGD